jgi:predicted PurR-regulated permease PerM
MEEGVMEPIYAFGIWGIIIGGCLIIALMEMVDRWDK